MSINPVRYPGGKGRKSIVNCIINAVGIDSIQGHDWIEPFCGGCGLGLELANRRIIRTATFSDSDPRVMAMWKEVSYDTDRLIDSVNGFAIDMDTFAWARSTTNDRTQSQEDIGLATLVLNRCCLSGYIDGGVIGGKHQNGKYKLDSRFNKKTITKNIAIVGRMVDEGIIRFIGPNDAVSVIKDTIADVNAGETAPDDLFLYVNPPYMRIGGRCYKEKVNHEELCSALKEASTTGIRWLLSYDDCPEVRDMYRGMNMTYLDMSYSSNASTRGKVTELLISNDDFLS